MKKPFSRMAAKTKTKTKTNSWQPIETAPTDGEVFIAYATNEAFFSFQFTAYRRTDGKIACMMSGDIIKSITHWRAQEASPTK
tara:strand:+ start:295 stop:543 length:249 start_codon:yes stop_codon:yes gene_type:complete